MKKLLLIFLTAVLSISCGNNSAKNTAVDQYLSEDSDFAIKTGSLSDFLEKLEQAAFFRNNDFLINPSLKEQLRTLSTMEAAGSVLVSFKRNKSGNYDYLFIAAGDAPAKEKDTLSPSPFEKYRTGKNEVTEFALEGSDFYIHYAAEVFLASNSREQVEKIIGAEIPPQSESLQKSLAAAASDEHSFLLNQRFLQSSLKENFPGNHLPDSPLSGWSLVDLSLSKDILSFNGVAVSREDKHILNSFTDLRPQNHQMGRITPSGAVGFYSFTYNSFQKLNQNLNAFRADSIAIEDNHFLNFTREAGFVFSEDNLLLALVSTDADLFRQAIDLSQESVEFRGFSIFRNTKKQDLDAYLRPLIKDPQTEFFALIDQFTVFSNDPDALQDIIIHYSNGNVLQHQEFYTEAISGLAGQSSLLMVANAPRLKSGLKNAASEDLVSEIEKLELQNISVTALQFVADKGFTHIHGSIQSRSSSASAEQTEQLYTLKLENPAAIKPVLLKNHLNDKVDIFVQDEKNIIYLFSPNGKLLWKKQLQGRLNAPPQQVDLFKNGNLQMAFTTQGSLQVLDRNGNPVKPFPMDFRDEITRPLSVFDYDNRRDYRFMVTRGKDVLMLDKNGKSVKGFNFSSAAARILQSPKHIRIGKKDYIVIPEEGGKLHILSRQGNSRIQVKERIEFSGNEWYLHEGQFISATANGELVRVDENGRVVRTPFFPGSFKLSATQKVLVALSENILRINDNEITLDFGVYTAPEIFEFRGNTYISVTDTQAGRVFIFNSKAELLPNFPVYGNSPIDLGNADADNSPEFVVRSEENALVVYKIR